MSTLPVPRHFTVSEYLRLAEVGVLRPGALLVVEVSDTSLAFDGGRKADIYARAGVPEYWIVDVKGASVEIRLDPGPQGYATTRIVRGDEAVLPLALEGRLAAPLRAADLLPRPR